MESVKSESAKPESKSKAKPSTDSLRVRRETKKKILAELVILNKEGLGKVTPDQYVALAISLLTSSHLEQLKQRSLTAKDRIEQRYREYRAQHGKVSKNDFLATLLK
jgi:hypothetical protein